MKNISIFNSAYTLTDGTANYASLREAYEVLAVEARDEFKRGYFSLFSSIDEIFLKWGSITEGLIDKSIEMAMQSLVDLEVYELSKSNFVFKYFSRYDSRDSTLEWLQGVYVDSMSSFVSEEQRIAAGNSGGGGIIGGGFGVEGAVKGIAIATAANVAIGAVQGLGRIIAESGNASAANKKKKELFKSSEVIERLSECLFVSVFAVHFAILDAVNDLCKERNPFAPPENGSIAKAQGIFENCKEGRIQELKQKEAMLAAIFMNPYDRGLYLYFLHKFGDAEGELNEFYSVHKLGDLKEIKKAALASLIEAEDTSTPELCDGVLEKAKINAEFLGYDSIELLADIKNRRERLDVQRKTFEGVVYSSVDEVETAKALSRRTTAGIVYATEDEAKVAQLEIVDRTVGGVVYQTIEEAKVEKGKKSVGFLLFLTILLAPLPNALVTFYRGYSFRARLTAAVWLVLYCLVVGSIVYSAPIPKDAAIVFFLASLLWGLVLLVVRKVFEIFIRRLMGTL
jgi:hypothetical protein